MIIKVNGVEQRHDYPKPGTRSYQKPHKCGLNGKYIASEANTVELIFKAEPWRTDITIEISSNTTANGAYFGFGDFHLIYSWQMVYDDH